MMKYQILTETGTNTRRATFHLQVKVNEELENGWKTIGGVSTCNESTVEEKLIATSQAMLKDE